MPASFDFTRRREELWVPIAFTAERKAHARRAHLSDLRTAEARACRPGRRSRAAQRSPSDLRKRFPKDDCGAELRGRSDDGGARRRLPAASLHPARGGRLRSAHRVRQHRQPAARARGRARRGDGDSRRARRRPRPDRPAAPHREPGARADLGRGGARARAAWGIRALIAAAPAGRAAPRADDARPDRRGVHARSSRWRAPSSSAWPRRCARRDPMCRRSSRKADAAPRWAASATGCAPA